MFTILVFFLIKYRLFFHIIHHKLFPLLLLIAQPYLLLPQDPLPLHFLFKKFYLSCLKDEKFILNALFSLILSLKNRRSITVTQRCKIVFPLCLTWTLLHLHLISLGLTTFPVHDPGRVPHLWGGWLPGQRNNRPCRSLRGGIHLVAFYCGELKWALYFFIIVSNAGS